MNAAPRRHRCALPCHALPRLRVIALLAALWCLPPPAGAFFSSGPFCPGVIFDPSNFVENLHTARRSATLVRRQAEATLRQQARLAAAKLHHQNFASGLLDSSLRLKDVRELRDFAAARGNLALLGELETLSSFHQSSRDLEQALAARFEELTPLLGTIADASARAAFPESGEALGAALSESHAHAERNLLHDYQREIDTMLEVQRAYVRHRALAARIPHGKGQQQSLQLLNTQLNELTVGMGQVVSFMIVASDGGLEDQRIADLERRRRKLDEIRRVGGKLDFIRRQGQYILGPALEQR